MRLTMGETRGGLRKLRAMDVAYGIEQHRAGRFYAVVVRDQEGRASWAGSGYFTRAGAQFAARRALRRLRTAARPAAG